MLALISISCQEVRLVQPEDITESEQTGSVVPVSEGEKVVHTYYQLAYSEEHEGALWVYYHLTPEFTNGTAERKDNFKEDPLVSTGSATLEDYKGSGYDRGHLCPAASMTINQTAMDESFYLSNMSPQHPSLNRGRWKSLETAVRDWVNEKGELHVVSGAIYNTLIEVIGPEKVSVPARYYKVIWDGESQMLGFMLPNEKCPNELGFYAVPVDSIEQLTGIDFFSIVPDQLENKIEAENNYSTWMNSLTLN
ncbi:DNA/RNA non-specific endonuclease [Roseimarinus sediminis]|uniref:DNA/RNA non-specific endonuclease n=1 Tax=Roseimarinus sediminis TaxID=1610899 RepID=UPI003D1DCB01